MWTPVGYTRLHRRRESSEPPLPLTNWGRVRCYTPLMANQTLSFDIRRFALAGAQARMAEISLELEAIRRAFPELRKNGSSGARARQAEVAGADEPTSRATTSSPHHVRCPAQSCWRTNEEVLGGAAGSNFSFDERLRPPKRTRLRLPRKLEQRREPNETAKLGPRQMSAAARKRMSAGAEEAMGGQAEGRLSGCRPPDKTVEATA